MIALEYRDSPEWARGIAAAREARALGIRELLAVIEELELTGDRVGDLNAARWHVDNLRRAELADRTGHVYEQDGQIGKAALYRKKPGTIHGWTPPKTYAPRRRA